jgi:hypothetical protein
MRSKTVVRILFSRTLAANYGAGSFRPRLRARLNERSWHASSPALDVPYQEALVALSLPKVTFISIEEPKKIVRAWRCTRVEAIRLLVLT